MDPLSLFKIKKLVADHYGVTVEDFNSDSREKPLVTYRQVAMWMIRAYTVNTTKDIGNDFGGRDHSSVIHATQSIDDLIDTNIAFRSSIFDLKLKIEQSLEISDSVDGAYETRI